MSRRAAILVGVDDHPTHPLTTCVGDANRMFLRLSEHYDGSNNFECRLITSAQQMANRALVLEVFGKALSSAAEEVVLYFAGHGGVDEHGGYLMAQDSIDAQSVVRMNDVLTMASESSVREVVILLDCCSASAMGEPTLGSNLAVLREGVSILTAARTHEIAHVGAKGAVFTSVLCEALDGGAADVRGRVTVAGTYAYVDESFGALQQRPELKAHVSRLVTLRHCEPAVPDEVLRRLPEWFPTPNHHHGLNRQYEPSTPPYSAEHEAIFRQLQRCRAANLVEPVGFEHMYDAAMADGSCRLTPLGRHYRYMAATNKI